MAVPKRRLSRSRSRHRKAQWTAPSPPIVTCGCPRREPTLAHRACLSCGRYDGRPVLPSAM